MGGILITDFTQLNQMDKIQGHILIHINSITITDFTQLNQMDKIQGHILIHINSITTTIKLIVLNLDNKMTLFVFN